MRAGPDEPPLSRKTPFATPFFRLLLLLLFFSPAGCAGPLNPFNHSFWYSARSNVESALLDGKAVVLVSTAGGNTGWGMIGKYGTRFYTVDNWNTKVFRGYRIIPVEPGDYTLERGYKRFDDTTFDLGESTRDFRTPRLGVVYFANREKTHTSQHETHEFASGNWEKDSNGLPRYVETNPSRTVTDIETVVVGHYAEAEIVTFPGGAAEKPLWAGFHIAPGEVVLLQSVDFHTFEADYTQCRLLSTGRWSCPVKSVQFVVGAEPDLEACRAAAAKEEFPPELVGRIVARKVTLGSLFDGPHSPTDLPSHWKEGASYIFESEAFPAAPEERK